MGPKAQRKSPSRSKSPKKGGGEAKEDTAFINATLSDGTWNAILAFVVPSQVYDELYIEQLEKTIKQGHRRKFSWITRLDLINQTVEQSSGKGGATAKKGALPLHPNDRMTPGLLTQMEQAKPFLENKEDIPDNVLIKILKSKLLHIRNVQIEKKSEEPAAKKAGGTTPKKDKSPSGKKSPAKAKKGGAATGPLPEIEKQSQLKKKEEIEEEENFIDDEPKDGPDYYFLISGFHNPAIFSYCEELNINIDCILKFKSKNYQRIKEFYKEIDDRERLETNLKANLKITADESNKDNKRQIDVEALSEERQAQMQKTANELQTFWRDINMILDKSSDKSILQNIARVKYIVDKSPELKSWFELEPRGEFSNRMFDGVAEKMYQLVIQKRQYKNYLSCLKLFTVPSCVPLFTASQINQVMTPNQTTNQVVQPAAIEVVPSTPGATGEQAINPEAEKQNYYDIRLYNDLMDSIAPEYISTDLIIHCMVEQIVSNEEKNNLTERSSTSTSKVQNLSLDVSQHFSNLIMNLPISQKEKESVLQFLPVSKNETVSSPPNYPYLINYNDEISVRLKTVTGTTNESTGKFIEDKEEKKFAFDLIQTQLSLLEKSPLTVFTGLPDVPKSLAKERAARLQELLHFCTSAEITYAEADRAFKQFIFESMTLTETDENSNIILHDQYSVIPWDDPYPNINSTLSEESQLKLKTMTIAETRALSPAAKRRQGGSSAGSVRSIKFQDGIPGDNRDSWGPSSILKSRPSTKLSVQSVHFDDVHDLTHNLESSPTKTVQQVVELVRNSRQRSLNEWYFAEHFEPKILVQILKDAVYTHPFINTYYNKRDHSIMLVLSNPYSEKTLTNYQESTIKLHSNVGFRNYLEKIYDMIIDFTRDEEAKYQGLLTSKEVQSFLSEPAENRSRPSSKSSDRKVKTAASDKSKKKKDETPQAVAGQQSVTEEAYITNSFIGGESLKAWKKEHDKQVAETQTRKIKSPKSKASAKDDKKDAKKDTKSPNRAGKSPNRSVSPKTRSPVREGSAGKGKPKLARSDSKSKTDDESVDSTQPKKVDGFVGYDVGNNMIYVNTSTHRMFPCDGSLIKTEKIELKTTSKTYITTSVIKNGNVFSLHLTDPKRDKSESETAHMSGTGALVKSDDNSNYIAKYGCFTGSFKDGFNISFSVYDVKPSLKIDTSNVQMIAPVQEQPVVPLPPPAADKKTNDKKKGKKEATPEPPVVEIKETPKFKILPWSQLFLSTPTGLSCTFLPETYSGVAPTADNEPHRLLVKQYYSAKPNNNSAETLPNTNHNMYKEKTRIFKSDGTVVKVFNDDTVEILYPNGSIHRKEMEIKEHPLEEVEETPVKKGRKKVDHKNEDAQTPRETKPKPKWTLVSSGGNKYELKTEKRFELAGFHRNIIQHDPHTGEVMSTREDGVKIINRPDGSTLAHFADGTRITTFYVQKTYKINDNETGEISGEKTCKTTKYYKIESHGFATTIFNNETSECTLLFGNGTFVSCNASKASYVVSHHKGDKIDINSNGVVSYSRLNFVGENNKETSSNKFLFYQNSDTILDHVDAEGNIFKIDKFGKCSSIPIDQSQSSSSSFSLSDYDNHAPRFFIIHKDSSGTELLRFQDIHDYMKEADIDPMVAIMRDCVQGHPNVMGTTVLKPLKDSIFDSWAIDYDEKEIVPYGLRCRDLSSFPSNPAAKTPGPKFGTKLGKGLDIKVEQKSEIIKNPPLIIPKRMEFRQIIEYEKLSDDTRNLLMDGLKNYIVYVAERAEKHRQLLTNDPRSEAEKLTAFKILKLARPDQLHDNDIVKLYGKGIGAFNDKDEETVIKSVKKTLPRRKPNTYENLLLEINREKTNKQIWKKTFVPPYFESIWGKAFLEREREKENNSDNQAPIEDSETQRSSEVKRDPKFIGQAFDDPQFKKNSPLPPIFKTNLRYIDNPSNNNMKQSYTYYQSKDVEKLDTMKVPNSIKATRGAAVPNTQFWNIEDPVRRKTKNTSIKASIMNGKSLEKRRGCEIYPNQVRFGLLKENCVYAFDIELVNVGIDMCRFKIKQFSPESGLSVVYRPGPIAAGMGKDITIVIHAIFQSQNDSEQISPAVAHLRHELEITTETDVIIVPIEADIATADEYHKIFRGNLEAGKTPKTRVLAATPSNSTQPKIRLTNLSDEE